MPAATLDRALKAQVLGSLRSGKHRSSGHLLFVTPGDTVNSNTEGRGAHEGGSRTSLAQGRPGAAANASQSPAGRTRSACSGGSSSASPWGRSGAAASRCPESRRRCGSHTDLRESRKPVSEGKPRGIYTPRAVHKAGNGSDSSEVSWDGHGGVCQRGETQHQDSEQGDRRGPRHR